MSSGFVSGGTVDNPVERDDEWRRAQAELEAERKAKADLAAQHNGKSLFEILQENKDKKQAEFEEKARYKLHVSLDDDEADYLREIEEKKWKQEESVRKDTSEQLEVFRRQQEEAEKKALEVDEKDTPKQEGAIWATSGRKRKKGPDTGLLKGLKLKKANLALEDAKGDQSPTPRGVTEPTEGTKSSTSQASENIAPATSPPKTETPAAVKVVPSAPKPANSLFVGYGSSDEDD